MQKPSILVVDDDPRYLELLKFTLDAEGFDVQIVQDSQTVCDIARSTPPDVIVTDVAMPGLDGYSMAMELKTDPRTAEIPVIFVSARGSEWERHEGLVVGAAEYVTKPFAMTDLIARIREVSSRRTIGEATK
jgi:DNA-binding response OmpR family regulator